MFNDFMTNLPIYLMRIPVMLLALTVHETAHGWAAYKLGDPTARNLGRLTLNPLKHLDPIGTICMILFGFGWAVPVPINTRHFKNGRRDMALSAAAGPASNLLLGFLGVFLYCLFVKLFWQPLATGNVMAYVVMLFLNVFYTMNISFAVFNLLPIPPLDGSRLLFVFLPPRLYFGLMRYERYIVMGMLLLLWFTDIFTAPLNFLVRITETGMFRLIELLPFF